MRFFNCFRPILIPAAIILIVGIVLPSIALATPPTPPAQIIMPSDKVIMDIRLEGREFRVPLKIRVDSDVRELLLSVRLIHDDALKPEQIISREYPIKIDKKGDSADVNIVIPAQEKSGTYRIECTLESKMDDLKGTLDRKMLYLVNDKIGQRILTPIQFRKRQTQHLKMEFQKALGEHPDKPDIRLLSENTIRVPDDITRKIVPFDVKTQLEVRAVGPADDLRPYINDRTEDNWDARDPLTIRGRITYQDFDGTWRPLVNVSVNIYDDDTFGDDHLGTTGTDWNGYWSFSVNNDDGVWQDGRDIYYEFHLGNTRWHVRDADGDEYRWKSATVDDLSDGSVVDFGSETGSTNPEAMQIFAMIDRGWGHVATVGGQDPGHIEVRYPEPSTSWSPGSERVRIEMGYNDGPDVVLHEYGHALMHYAFGGTGISPGGYHSFCQGGQDRGLAYSEGWATAFMLSLCPDGMFNWHEGTIENAGEYPSCGIQNDWGLELENFWCSFHTGEEEEGWVAAAINDFIDADNDDNGGSLDRGRNGESDQNSADRVSLATIYRDVMWGHVYYDFLEFWIALAGEISGTKSDMAGDIMQYNWMSLPIELNCAASKVAVAERKDKQNLLTGLRSFRDNALKPLRLGRTWIQKYYDYSPELAMLIIKNKEFRSDAVKITEHFSSLGYAISNEDSMSVSLRGNRMFISKEIAEAIANVLSLIEKNGSRQLKQELIELRSMISLLEGKTIAEVMREGERIKKFEEGRLTETIRPVNPKQEDKEIDWKLIKEHLR